MQSWETIKNPTLNISENEGLMYEVMVPKKLSYYKHIQDVLEGLFNIDQILSDPVFRDRIDRGVTVKIGQNSEEPLETALRYVSSIFTGYSMYEVDGRFRCNDGRLEDERVIVVRFFFHETQKRDDQEWHEFVGMVTLAVRHLVAIKLAERLDEDEVWLVEHASPRIHIVKRK